MIEKNSIKQKTKMQIKKQPNKKIITNIKFKKTNIFIAINILFLLGCIIFYSSRLIYYYKIEHPKVAKNEELINLVTLEKNITTIGSGLYQTDDGYVYKGTDLANYIHYSGRIWRVVSVDSDNNIKLITDDSQTSLVWGISTDYENSYVRSWLNDDNDMQSFYESLADTSNLLTTKTCMDVISEKSITCKDYIEDKVGLLSAYEYQLAGGEDSYLNIDEYWWTSNINSDETAWYVYSKGSLNDTSYSNTTYYSFGVRPTITIKGTVEVKSGEGTSDNPYNLDSTTSNILNQKYVGNYISYSNYTWRIIETNDDYVKIVMDGVVKEDEEDYYTSFGTSNYYSSTSGVGYYLNKTFYNSLSNKDYILKHAFFTGRYDSTNKYDFNQITDYSETVNVGLLQLGELFVTDTSKYFLATRTKTTDNNIYQVLENGRIYAGDLTDELRLRPTLYLKSDLAINSGSGTKKDPYIIG